VEQLAFADVILLNKTDLIEDEDKARILRRIKVGAHCSSRC
jgi:G3E family GTPase